MDSMDNQTKFSDSLTLIRKEIHVNGIVQGVGFRPFIFKLAHTHQLDGQVCNTELGVSIDVHGSVKQMESFLQKIKSEAPPLSIISSIQTTSLSQRDVTGFSIHVSQKNAHVSTSISPDVTVCPECLKECFDPSDRRYHYPFINCTYCGPRFTIIESLPYDRPMTSMNHFELCPKCKSEYENPVDRRFHAQPNACPDCGPHVSLYDNKGNFMESNDPIHDTATLLKKGHIVAIKGLGGYHLCVDATYDKGVSLLRKRKHRDEKPLAVMVGHLDDIHLYCDMNPQEEKSLTSKERPIVLLKKKKNSIIGSQVATDYDRLGVMLPYTPLHHILFSFGLPPLIMTSANISEEPICTSHDDVIQKLGGMVDFVLSHNRDILVRSDDSVVVHMGKSMIPIRRSRGYAPAPFLINQNGPPVLAVGGELKNTICLLKNRNAYLSQHIGDLSHWETFRFFKKTIHHFQ